jgi:DNA ligase-1
MKSFAKLYKKLDETTKTNEKIEALVRYFSKVDPADGAWAVYFLSGRRLKRLVQLPKLKLWAAEAVNISAWLFDECYEAVGDLAETISLLHGPVESSSELPLHKWIAERILPLRDADDETAQKTLVDAWRKLDEQPRYVWNKLITGGFRVGVSQRLITRALAQVAGIDASVIAHRLMGPWEPTVHFYQQLLAKDAGGADISRPYPFFLAHPLSEEASSLGTVGEWQVEWKWDGIRAQLIRRRGEAFLWSRGEELISEQFPELVEAGKNLPEGIVIDGEVLPWKKGEVLPFSRLQRRLGRKRPNQKVLSEFPVTLLAYDLLEKEGRDIREKPLKLRRELLAELLEPVKSSVPLNLSPVVQANSWKELSVIQQQSRSRKVEGLMLKRLSSPYHVGRRRGDWWKWKLEPLTADAVLIYAQRGHGRRASLYTDYTFGVWDDNTLVPFAKAYSGLTDEEIRAVDRFIRNNIKEKFGPVRSVRPELVFELAFESIQRSKRHKSGVAVRFPRIHRWRKDKDIQEADTLETVKALLADED